MIAIDDLHKSYRTADGRLSAVLKGLSLQVPERSITAVVGPSGVQAGSCVGVRLYPPDLRRNCRLPPSLPCGPPTDLPPVPGPSTP